MPEPLSRSVRIIAGTTALALGAVALVAGMSSASAGTPRAQAVGRFLDGQLGGKALESVIDLKDARASNPGNPSERNPLDVTLGGQGTIPLSGKAHLPGRGNAVHLGAANQVARAKSDGFAFGAAGAVANSGGASIGGSSGRYPSNATLDLTAAAIPKPGQLALPGAGGAAALGGITASIGAVSALAATPAGFSHGTRPARTAYRIGSLTLSIGSPALGGVLAKLGSALKAPKLPAASVPGLPASCSFKNQALSTLHLDAGAVVIDPGSGSLSVNLVALLRRAGADINALPANTDLLGYLTDYLGSSKGLAAGLQSALHGVLDPLQANFTTCLNAFTAKFPPPLDTVVRQALQALTSGQQQVQQALNQTVDQLTAAGGSSPLAPLADGLAKALDLGVNVQPNGARGSFSSALAATADQADSPVRGQTLVRAIEIDLLPAAGSPAAVLALANAAAGPSVAPTTSAPPTRHSRHHADAPPGAQVPTGVPAGRGTTGGGPSVPIGLLVAAGALAAVGLVTARLARGR